MTSWLRSLSVLLCAVVLLSAGSATTFGYFVDTERGSGTIQAANSFPNNGGGNGNGNGNGGGNGNNGNPGQTGPPGRKAYNDANGNGQYDNQSEQTYQPQDLVQFSDQSANLVIPEDVGTIENNGNVQITANSISSEVDIVAKNGNVDLDATGGAIELSGTTVKSTTGSVEIDASGDIVLDGATVDSKNENVDIVSQGSLDLDGATITSNGQITLVGQRISARNAVIDGKNGQIVLTATRGNTGGLVATNALVSSNENVRLESDGDIRLDESTIHSKNGERKAVLGSTSDTLYVDQASILDGDRSQKSPGTLLYQPSGATVVGDPSTGTVEPN